MLVQSAGKVRVGDNEDQRGMSGCMMKKCERAAVSVFRVRKTGCESVVALKRIIVRALPSPMALCIRSR